MATQVTLDRMIGRLKLEMTDDVGERGGIPRCGRGVKCVEGECVICEEEREVETALAVAVACREQAGDPVSGTEACQMALRVIGGMDQYSFHARIGSGRVERYVHMCGGCMKGQWAMVGPDTNVTVVVSGMKCVKCGTEHILQSLEHAFS
eukprot:scaffold81597_cov53-Attheya_sp.AAC.1